jgi:hypothetical protein
LGTDEVVVLELVGVVTIVVAAVVGGATVGAVVVRNDGSGLDGWGATHAPATRATSDETPITTTAGPRREREGADLDIVCHL